MPIWSSHSEKINFLVQNNVQSTKIHRFGKKNLKKPDDIYKRVNNEQQYFL